MSDRQSNHHELPKKSRKMPLSFILISQFVVLIVGISGITLWLSWRSEQEAIANLVEQLQNEISDRIEQKLTTFLEVPHLINQINDDAINRGELKLQDRFTERYLWQQIKQFPSVSWIYYGGEQEGEFVGITRLESDRSLLLAINYKSSQRYSYNLDQQGNRMNLVGDSIFYDARQRPWYQAALKTNKPTWSEIYQDSALPEQVITASVSIKDANGKRIGVLGADISLGNISSFLRGLKIGKSGQAFIVEPSGLIVASSTLEQPYAISANPQKPQRLPIKDSKQPLIRSASQYLDQQFGSLAQIKTEQQLEFQWEGQRQFLKVLPYRDDRGINWLIAVVIPASDFTEQINANRITTSLLSFLVLGAAIALGILTAHNINKPVRRLTLASQSLANGELDREIPGTEIDELNILSQAFNQMAARLKQSFTELENTNEGLENRIKERTAALSSSEEQFRTLVANILGVVYRCTCDSDWTMEFIGGAVEEITGYATEDFIHSRVRSWSSIIHPEDRDMVELNVEEGVKFRQPFIIEYRIIDAHNNIRWLYEKGQGVFAHDGSLLWLDGAIFDISDRKQVEADLLERVHLSILMSEIASAITQFDTLEEILNGCVESIWRHMDIAFAQIWTLNEVEGVLDLQARAGLYHLSDEAHSRILVGHTQIGAIAQNRQPYLTNEVLKDPQISEAEWIQRESIVSFAGYPLMVKDQVVGVMAMFGRCPFTNTTLGEMESVANAIALGIDRKQSEEKILAANAEMGALFAAMDDLIFVVDSVGRVLKIPSTERQRKFRSANKMLGKLCSEIFPPEQAAIFESSIQQSLEIQQTINIEYKLPFRNREIWLNARISPINADTVIWVARDITDRRQAEQDLKQAKQAAEAASQAKGQFLASMSHELRTPLNVILGFTQLMARDASVKDSHRSYLKIVHESGEHLLELINDVLDMSKIESGRMTLNETSFDLYHLLNMLEEMFQLKTKDKTLELIFERSPTVPQCITTDEGKLRQILINLLSNAIKFTDLGTVRLFVGGDYLSSAQVESPGLTPKFNLCFEIADTGAGIPVTQLEKIFEAFEQTEVGRQSPEGTGLGLPISRKFAQLMGGEITVNSKLGEGSIFQFSIPVDVPEQISLQPRSPERYVIGLAPNQPDFRLLVVEDRWESRHFLVKLLESIGFQVQEAENGAQAIAIWEQWQPHLIWMDMRMPIMDGYEATRQIKSHLKGQATVIIALTASALEEEKAIVISAGCDDFVRKPFREAVILDKVAEFLGVVYLYKDEINQNAQSEETSNTLTPNHELVVYLSQMPNVWIAQLHQAATLADNDLIAELLKSISTNNPHLTQGLTKLVDNFGYNQIMVLAQNALRIVGN